jgi:hypothetical protein
VSSFDASDLNPRPRSSDSRGSSVVFLTDATNELIEMLLPLIIRLDQAHMDACALEAWVGLRTHHYLNAYPSARWYSLFNTPSPNAPPHRDPVKTAAERWVAAVNRRGHESVTLTVHGEPDSARDPHLNNYAARELKRWLERSFAHRPSELMLRWDQASGDLIVRIRFHDSRRPLWKRVHGANESPSGGDTSVLAGYFLAREAESLCQRSDTLSDYDIASRQSVISSVYETASTCRVMSDALIRSNDNLIPELLHGEVEPKPEATTSPNVSESDNLAHERASFFNAWNGPDHR